MFLTPDEIEQLTGYKKPKLQRDWLTEHGYRFEVRRDGRASVLSSHVTNRLGAPRERRVEPNWKALG